MDHPFLSHHYRFLAVYDLLERTRFIGKDTCLYYLPEGNLATHLQIEGKSSDQIEVTWFNPLTGEYKQENSRS
jgi:hypothetical protein